MSFGKVISEARKQKGLSQKELAKAVDLSPQYVNDIEHGKRNPDSDIVIESFASALNIKKDILYFWARRLPPDVLDREPSSDEIGRAYTAFRKSLTGRR